MDAGRVPHRLVPRRLLLVGVAALLAVIGPLLGGCGGNVGTDTAAGLASPTPLPPAGSGVPVVRGDLPAAATVIEPATLVIPAIGVTATVRPVGIDPATGELSVPPSVDTVGWYRYGPGLEATAGSVVIAGHVDSAEQGRGAFFRLKDLKLDDQLRVTGADGAERTYRIVAREEWPKSRIPLDQYFGRDGGVRLTLITCGGPFDEATRNYRDNVVITAVPAA